jgi:hypothetical protein
MSQARGGLRGLERRPWTLALLAGAGLTLLVPSGLALYGPPELLDAAVALGDARLAAGLLALLVVSTAVLRVLLRRRRLPEEEVDEEPLRRSAAPTRQAPEASPAAARAHLR